MNKTAWSYIRISTEDQSNFSISGQQDYNGKFSERHNITITKTFIDDGYSAADFNRPNWKQLEKEITHAAHKPDYIVVMKYDRLIRNAADGLTMLNTIENKLGVYILSAMELFFIDLHSPYFFKIRANMFVDAEFELRVIRDRTKFGIWSGKMSGRFIGVAPFGYRNSRDHDNKPIILVDEQKSKIIQGIFSDYLDGLAHKTILKRAREKGFTIKGNSVIRKVIMNHTYAGLLNVRAYKDEPAQIVRAKHTAIIDESTFWNAYYKMSEQMRPKPKATQERLPLRGVILCRQCGGYLTGSRSKGRHGKYWWYYRCLHCAGETYRSEKATEELIQVLQMLSLPDSTVKIATEMAEEQLRESVAGGVIDKRRLSVEISTLQNQIESLEQKYISDKIDHETFEKWIGVYRRDLSGKRNQLQNYVDDVSGAMALLKQQLPKLTDLSYLWEKASLDNKQGLLRSLFEGGLIKLHPYYLTPFLPKIFDTIQVNSSILHVGMKDTICNVSPRCPQIFWNQTPFELLRFIATIAA